MNRRAFLKKTGRGLAATAVVPAVLAEGPRRVRLGIDPASGESWTDWVTFDEMGRAVIRSRAHQEAFRRAMGLF